MVTQKDVAEYAGVSFITVSRVVNKEKNVKEETRLKVEDAIQKLGYFPGFAGQALNSGLCKTIAVLTPINLEDDIRASYLMSVLSGINNSCIKNNCDIMLTTFQEDDKTFDYLRPFKQHKVDGIIYVGLKEIPQEMLDEIKSRKHICVVIGDRPQNELFSWVDTNNEKAAYETTVRIWNNGHRKIFFHGLTKDIYNANIFDREKGFIKAIKELTGSFDESMIIRSGYDNESISNSLKNTFSSIAKEKMPTAIFCSTDSRIPLAIKELKKIGLSVPNDISLVGFDGFLVNSPFFDFSISTNKQPLYDMGKRAAEILFEHIKEPTLPRTTELFDVQFLPGESLKKTPS